MLPVVPDKVQSGATPFGGGAVGHEPAAAASPDPSSVTTIAATHAVNATENTRSNFTAVTLQAAPGPGTPNPARDLDLHMRTRFHDLQHERRPQ
jgi:hypothetical protein